MKHLLQLMNLESHASKNLISGLWIFCFTMSLSTALLSQGQFVTEGSKILSPCGQEFYGSGFNGAFNVTTYPFVFQGTDGQGGSPCYGAWDIWPDQANSLNGTPCYPGGGFNSSSVWSPQLNSLVDLPDRYYAVNGYYSDIAKEAGITEPADHWSQNIIRVNLVCMGETAEPSFSSVMNHAINGVREALNAGLVVIPVNHSGTGSNHTPTANWDDPIEAFTGNLACAVRFVDQITSEFGIDNSADLNSSEGQGYVWLEPMNEPWGWDLENGCPKDDYFDTQTFWIERIRNYHGAENIIVIDLANWGQSLDLLAAGCYDDWWTSLKNHPSGDLTRNIILGWHAYGARASGGGYTYEQMDQDLKTVLIEGTSGGYTYPIMVGEYGQAAEPGTGNAGPDQFNRNAVEYLMTSMHGEALALKYNLHPTVWNATGDAGFSSKYKLVQGPEPQRDDGLATPFWDVESGDDPLLEPLGRYHWSISHTNSARNNSCDGCNLTGLTCDDNNQCTINDKYDSDCNCIGYTSDSDGDGVCDSRDVCPGSDDLVDLNTNGIPDGCETQVSTCNPRAGADFTSRVEHHIKHTLDYSNYPNEANYILDPANGPMDEQWPETFQPGDVLYINPGLYTINKTLEINESGTFSQRIIIMKTPNLTGDVVIDGKGMVADFMNIYGDNIHLGGTQVNFTWKPDFVIQNFTNRGIRIFTDADNVRLHHIEFNHIGSSTGGDNGMAIRISGNDHTIEYCSFINMYADMIQLETSGEQYVNYTTIRNNFAWNDLDPDNDYNWNALSHSDFIQIQDGPATDFQIYNNLLIGFTNALVLGDTWGSVSNVDVFNNLMIFDNNGVNAHSQGNVEGTWNIYKNTFLLRTLEAGGGNAIVLKDTDGSGVVNVEDNVFYGGLDAINVSIDNSLTANYQNNIHDGNVNENLVSTLSSVSDDTGYSMVNARDLSSISSIINDSDGDGVCDEEDACLGFDDTIDVDGNGVPDDCEVILSISTINLKVKETSSGRLISWAIDSDTESGTFVLESRTDDYSQFSKIDQQQFDSQREYFFLDQTIAQSDVIYYRVKFVKDHDQSILMSKIVALDLEHKRANHTLVYPNPTSDLLNIAIDGDLGIVVFKDIYGRQVEATYLGSYRKDAQSIHQFDIGHFTAGCYVMTVEQDGKAEINSIVIKTD